VSFTIGRCSFTNAPSAIRYSGDTVQINIDILPPTLAEAKVLRQQVLGLDDNADEAVVPVTWSDDSDLDGFYRVQSVDVEATQAYLVNKLMRCSITAERVGGGYALPRIDVITGTLERDDSIHTSQGGSAIAIAVPASSAATFQEAPYSIADDLTSFPGSAHRPCADEVTVDSIAWDSVWVREASSAGNGEIISHYSMWLPAPLFYFGACRVEVEVGGTWYGVMGRQIGLHRKWRISNGIVRLTSADGSTPGTLEAWNGAAWISRNITHWSSASTGSEREYGVGGYEFEYDRQSPVQVVRNSPERVVVSCTAGPFDRIFYAIQRGDRMFTMVDHVAGTNGIGLTSPDHTAITENGSGGGAYTGYDGTDGMSVVLASEVDYGLDLTNGALWGDDANATYVTYGIGMTDDSGGTADGNARLTNQYFGIAPVLQLVVLR
jgi:hypothetical protein